MIFPHRLLEQGPVFGPEAFAFAEYILKRLDRVEDQLWGIGVTGQLPLSPDAVLRSHGIKIGNRMVQCEPQVKVLIDGAPARFAEPEVNRLYMASTEARRARKDKVSFAQFPKYRAKKGTEGGRGC